MNRLLRWLCSYWLGQEVLVSVPFLLIAVFIFKEFPLFVFGLLLLLLLAKRLGTAFVWTKRFLSFSYRETYQLLISWGSLLKKQQTTCRCMVSHLFAFKSIELIKYLCYVQVINNLWLFTQPLNTRLSSAPAHILVRSVSGPEWFARCLRSLATHCGWKRGGGRAELLLLSALKSSVVTVINTQTRKA